TCRLTGWVRRGSSGRAALLLVIAAALHAAPGLAATSAEFLQTTRVEGTPPGDLAGTWFVCAQAELPADKTGALPPELWTVSRPAAGQLVVRLLDVELPRSIDEQYRAGSRQPKAWMPSPADLELLRKEWSRLPRVTKRDVHRGDVDYEAVEVVVAAPQRYGDVFPKRDRAMEDALAGSLFALQVTEKFRPLPVPPGENIAQLQQRKSVYVVRSATDSVLEGKHFTGYVAAGPGMPIPITVAGPFRLYRLPKGT